MGFRPFNLRGISRWALCGTFAHHRHWPAGRHHGVWSLNFLRMSKYFINLTMQSRILCNQFSESAVHLPWRQNVVDNTKEDPILHRLFGMILLRRVFRNCTREEFDTFGFIEGVKIAVQALSDSITSHDREGHMVNMLGNHLHERFHKAFDELTKANQKAVLEVATSRNFKVIGVRLVCGNADPDDEYCISFLGQKIITSKHDMFELEKRANFAGISSLFDYGKQLGYSAAEKQLKFQLDVKFSSNERFYIQEKQNGNGQVVLGSEDLIFATHCIRFETPLEDVNSSYDKYPFSWKIIDIDFEYNEKDH